VSGGVVGPDKITFLHKPPPQHIAPQP
jgi:hypothetical protein